MVTSRYLSTNIIYVSTNIYTFVYKHDICLQTLPPIIIVRCWWQLWYLSQIWYICHHCHQMMMNTLIIKLFSYVSRCFLSSSAAMFNIGEGTLLCWRVVPKPPQKVKSGSCYRFWTNFWQNSVLQAACSIHVVPKVVVGPITMQVKGGGPLPLVGGCCKK